MWLYHRFPLSFREVEELMLERGIVVSYETLAALDVPRAVTAPVPSRPEGPDPAGDVVVQPVPSDASGQECQGRGDTMAEKERRVMERVRRMHEPMRNHTKAELLRMAYAGGLVRFDSPEKWRKDEIASTVVDIELRTAVRPDRARSAEDTTAGGLMGGQRERLEALGVTALPPKQELPAKAPSAASRAFERGVAALAVQGPYGHDRARQPLACRGFAGWE